MYSVYTFFGRKITINAVMYGVYVYIFIYLLFKFIRFWPHLHISAAKRIVSVMGYIFIYLLFKFIRFWPHLHIIAAKRIVSVMGYIFIYLLNLYSSGHTYTSVLPSVSCQSWGTTAGPQHGPGRQALGLARTKQAWSDRIKQAWSDRTRQASPRTS
jgi:hypothetical protein